jgi:tRNA1(Val) A37 N6-methylase TrmN6
VTDTLVLIELQKLNAQIAKIGAAFNLLAKEAHITQETLNKLVADMEKKSGPRNC